MELVSSSFLFCVVTRVTRVTLQGTAAPSLLGSGLDPIPQRGSGREPPWDPTDDFMGSSWDGIIMGSHGKYMENPEKNGICDIYIYIYVCMYVYTYIYIYTVYIYICVCVFSPENEENIMWRIQRV